MIYSTWVLTRQEYVSAQKWFCLVFGQDFLALVLFSILTFTNTAMAISKLLQCFWSTSCPPLQMLIYGPRLQAFLSSASLQQTQRSVHNSNSCSCILIQSAGLSLKCSIFLHFRNYSRARECGPGDPRGWSPVRVSSPSAPAASLRICWIPAPLSGVQYTLDKVFLF